VEKTPIFVPPGYTDWKPLKLRDLEFANSILPTEGTQTIGYELAMSQVLIEIIRKADRRPE